MDYINLNRFQKYRDIKLTQGNHLVTIFAQRRLPDAVTQEKIPKIQSLFYLVFPWIHQYPCSDESQVWIEPRFFLDYFVQYRKSVIFPALDIKKQASTWIFRKPRGCTLFYLLSRFGKSVWITKYPD